MGNSFNISRRRRRGKAGDAGRALVVGGHAARPLRYRAQAEEADSRCSRDGALGSISMIISTILKFSDSCLRRQRPATCTRHQ